MKRLSTLTLLFLAGLFALAAAACSDHPQPLQPDAAQPQTSSRGASVVQVAPPTGTYPADRVSIEAALAQVQPGGTLQFAPGMYVIGNPEPFSWDFLSVATPQVTLLGHPNGTTLRGCEPAVITQASCNGLELSGGHQTVRNLAFEYMWVGVILGSFDQPPSGNTVGGYLVEESTFRNSVVGVGIFGGWTELAVIRHNLFVNLAWAVESYGRIFHVLDNEISAPQPELIPWFDRGWMGIYSEAWTVPCDDNVFVGNQIDGFVDGIGIEVWDPGIGCRRNVIRNNIIRARGATDLEGWLAAAVYLSDGTGGSGLLRDNLIEDNEILEAEGTAVVLQWASLNRVAGNTISGVLPMRHGLFFAGDGILVWQGHENQILDNYFDDPATLPLDIGTVAVVLTGNFNHVATIRASDWVRDLGVGNTVTGPGHVIPYAASAADATSARDEAPRRLRERGGLAGVLREREALRALPR